MLWTPKTPAPAPRPLGTPLPRKHPVSLHPSCVLALLPQNDPKWHDYSGHGNHGIVHGATPTAKGPDGFAWEFDGVDNHVEVASSPSLSITSAITLAARFATPVPGKSRNAVLGNYITGALFLGPVNILGPGEAHFAITAGDVRGTILTAPNIISPNTWYDIVGVYDGSQIRLYLHHTLIGQAPLTGTLVATADLWIGNFPAPGHGFHGLIDYVLIYNRAWSPRPQDANYLPEIDPFL